MEERDVVEKKRLIIGAGGAAVDGDGNDVMFGGDAARRKDAVHSFNGQREQIGRLDEIAAQLVGGLGKLPGCRFTQHLELVLERGTPLGQGEPGRANGGAFAQRPVDVASGAEFVAPASEGGFAGGVSEFAGKGDFFARDECGELVEEQFGSPGVEEPVIKGHAEKGTRASGVDQPEDQVIAHGGKRRIESAAE